MDFKLFIFDMDGTIVDSALDFDEMRREMNFPEGVPLLEHIEELAKTESKEQIKGYLEVIHKHEVRGAQRAIPMPGATEFLDFLNNEGIQVAVLTRNSLEVARMTFNKLNWKFELVVGRDCVERAKPYPDGLFHICDRLGVKPSECCYMGDFSFDLQTAKSAKMPAVLYAPKENEALEKEADIIVRSFDSLRANFSRDFLKPLNFSLPSL